MPSHLAAVRVLLKQIALEDDTFSLLPWLEPEVPETLVHSIGRVGILHPPLLQARPAGYRVIAGRRRLLAAREELKAAGCTCLVLPAEAPALEGLALSLEDTIAVRPLSAVERAFFLRKAGRLLDAEQLASRFSRLLNLDPGTDFEENCRLLELEEPLLQALHAGRLEEGMARNLGRLPFIDRLALFEIMELLGMGGGEQQELVKRCREAARRENRSILHLLSTPAAKEIIEAPATDPARKTAGLLELLAGRG